jgi:thioredoxin-like negative regulator of GroEL
MTASRIEKIQAMLDDDPQDVFLRYSLAMEQEKIGNCDASEVGLRGLMADEPPYVPAFFMLAQHLAKQDRVTDAREILRDGIEQARQQTNMHAAGEMSEFLASLGELGQ